MDAIDVNSIFLINYFPLIFHINSSYSVWSMDNKTDSTQPASNSNAQPAMSMVELRTLINRYLGDIEKTKEQMKAQKQMFDDTFGNDPKYRELAEKAKQATKAKSAQKQILLKTPSVQPIVTKMNEIKEEINTMQEALSGYVSEYQRLSGATVFEGENGQMMRIVHVYKLVRSQEE